MGLGILLHAYRRNRRVDDEDQPAGIDEPHGGREIHVSLPRCTCLVLLRQSAAFVPFSKGYGLTHPNVPSGDERVVRSIHYQLVIIGLRDARAHPGESTTRGPSPSPMRSHCLDRASAPANPLALEVLAHARRQCGPDNRRATPRPSHTSATKRRKGACLWTGTAEEFGADCGWRQSIAADLPRSIRHADRAPTV
jgi:hypothetical protein